MASLGAQPRLPHVAVVTVSYGSGAVLPHFLDSVASASVDPLLVIVADNLPGGPDIRSLTLSAGATYLPLDGNLGYGGAINAAAVDLPAQIEWILVSNPDVALQPGSLDVLLKHARSSDRIGSVGPAILTATGTLYPSARAVPSLGTGIGHALFANLWVGNPWTRAYRNDRASDGVQRDAGWLSGACVLVRRSVFDELGGFDTSFFMYFEDVDLGFRLGRAGYRNVYVPTATVTHTGAHSTTEHSAAMIRAHHASAKRFIGKKYSGALLFPVRAVLGLSLDVRSLIERRRPIG